jgi:5'-nucleotidase, C-terminal domain
VVHLVVSWTTLLPGDLFDCQSEAGISNDTTAATTAFSCTGGVAATAAYARYYASQTDNHTTTKTLVVPFLDTTSTLVQIHPLGWSLNRLVLQSKMGWNVCLSSPSILTQNRVDYSISPRDISDLQTLQLPLLLTNVVVPPTNSWYPYTEAVHFDAATGLALVSIYSSNQFLNVDQIAAARGILNYIDKVNQQAGCDNGNDDDDEDVYDQYMNETSTSGQKDGTCYLPVILYADVKERLDDFILVIAWHEHPPALILDTAGSATDLYATPRAVGPSGVWIHSFGLEQDMYHQHVLNITTTSYGSSILTNVSFVVEPLADLPPAAQDDAYQSDMSFLEGIADEALASDPVVGMSGYVPVHRVGSYRRCNGGECPLGNLFTDALRWRTSADVAFVSSGGLRGPGWAAGPVHMSDIWRALPFPNTYV